MSANKWIVASSVAFALSAFSAAAQAEDMITTPTADAQSAVTAPTPTGTQTMGGPSATSGAQVSTPTQPTVDTNSAMNSWTSASSAAAWPVDYKVLMGKSYDYTDLQAAKAKGYDDSHIAVFANIADKAGVPFNQIVDDVDRGMTFAAIGQKYGLTDNQIYDAQSKITEIKDYKLAYQGVMPPESDLYAMAVSHRDQALMARALAPSPLPTLSPIATSSSSSSQIAERATTTSAPAVVAEAPVTDSRPVLAHRTMTATVRPMATVHHRKFYARIVRHRYSAWRPMARHHIVKRYHRHASMSSAYHRGS